MGSKEVFLSVVIPQYNELSNLKKGLLYGAFDYLKTLDFEYEVLIVDDGSTDGSLEYLENHYKDIPFLKVIKAKHGGKPVAIYEGIKQSSGNYILFTDMDQSTPLPELEKLLPFIPRYGAVIGSRGNKRISATMSRKIAGKVFSSFRKLFLLRSIDDTQCGFKLFEHSIVKKVFPKLHILGNKSIKGWSVSAFDVELLYLIERYGYKIKEVKVKWQDQDISNTKNRKFIHESLDMIKQILMVVFKKISGRYDT